MVTAASALPATLTVPATGNDAVRVAATATNTPAELPGGGRSILPEHRVLAHYGAPQARKLGILGIGSPEAAGRRLRRHVREFQTVARRPIMPAMELIAVIATAAPGVGGRYRFRQPDAIIARYHAAARAAGALLILDIQPGRSDFVTETTALEQWLREPDVGIALDPEWRVGPGQRPGRVIGSVSAVEINATTRWLAGLVKRHDLPDKLVIVHQFTDGMIRTRDRIVARPGIDLVLNADGFGTPAAKRGTYRRVTRDRRPHFPGFKLFYEEDTRLMSPRQVIRLTPPPLVVIYE